MGMPTLIKHLTEAVESGEVASDDIVMLTLESSWHFPVGYVWGAAPQGPLMLYQTSGMATTLPNEDICKKIDDKAVDISKGDYLGYTILGYRVIGNIEDYLPVVQFRKLGHKELANLP